MKAAFKHLVICLVAVCLLGVPAARALDGVEVSYTYTYDYWGDILHSPDAYRTEAVLTSSSLGLDLPMRNPQGLFVRGNRIYICDTGNNRVLEITRQNRSYTVSRIIDTIQGDAEPRTFLAPQDVFVAENGDMFIADTNNHRIVKLDRNGNYLLSFTRPVDPSFDQSQDYLPIKLVADSTGRVYVQGKNINKGLVKYEADGSFSGFIGASEVKVVWYEYIWKLLSTKEQRAQQESFVPTEYDNVAIDEKGFFYVVTSTFDTNELKSGLAKPIRRLNGVGSNILVENGIATLPIGDLQWAGNDTNITNSGPSKLIDITPLKNEIYVALDSTHNRLFGYDQQGNLLWAFGGIGNMDGYFLRPVALEHMDDDLLVLDAQECAVTIMTPTEYGALIYEATDLYRKGEYAASADMWRKVMEQNRNLDIAYVGIGRALLQQEQFEEAQSYFRIARDTKNYSEAWKFHRKEIVERNIGWIFGVVFLLLLLPPVVRRIKKVVQEVNES